MDMWAVGAIMAEMVTKRPMLPGDSEIDELFRIFRIFGTPSEDTWAGVTSLPDWNNEFPTWPSLKMECFVPGFSEQGTDLIERMMALDPKFRITAKDALAHPYLANMAASDSF